VCGPSGGGEIGRWQFTELRATTATGCGKKRMLICGKWSYTSMEIVKVSCERVEDSNGTRRKMPEK
jgi:hypothetical protein